jgi:PPM family protein phosphatase
MNDMDHATYATEIGHRENLEDRARILDVEVNLGEPKRATCGIVLDGVGGQEGGEVASSLAADEIGCSVAVGLTDLMLFRPYQLDAEHMQDMLTGSLLGANQAILERARKEPSLTGMATTAICAVIVEDGLHIAYAGDSRGYLSTHEGIRQLSHDHSEAQELLDAGLLTELQARTMPVSHTITQFLGKPDGLEPAAANAEFGPDSVAVLCTDGLTDVLADDQIDLRVRQWREGHLRFADLPRRLIQDAMEAGTQDNITVACLRQAEELSGSRETVMRTYPLEAAKALERLNKELNHDGNDEQQSRRRSRKERQVRAQVLSRVRIQTGAGV